MYLVVIAWSYVVLMMSLAEAFSPQGSLLGAFFTLLMYGVLPLSIVVYILGTPGRKRALARQQAEAETAAQTTHSAVEPDKSGHATGGSPNAGITAVGKEE